MKIFSFAAIVRLVTGRALPGDGDDRMFWRRDPLSHPAIERMSQREVADLPFRMTATPTRLEC